MGLVTTFTALLNPPQQTYNTVGRSENLNNQKSKDMPSRNTLYVKKILKQAGITPDLTTGYLGGTLIRIFFKDGLPPDKIPNLFAADARVYEITKGKTDRQMFIKFHEA